MKFANHLFISYARLDNEKTEENDPGWVDRFYKSLRAFLSRALAETPRIWWDNELRGNEAIPEGIAEQLPKTAVLISIVSRRYLISDWCRTEIRKFYEVAEAQGGLVVDNKMRICRVMIMPDSEEVRAQLPGKVKDQNGYPFFDKKRMLDPRFGEEAKAEFNARVNDLAEQLAELIRKLNGDENPASEPKPAESAGPPKPIIYLAECSWDRENDRRKISSELRATGYTVLPDQGTRLPDLEDEYAAEVEKSLDSAQLSIHIVGANPSTVLNGPGRRDAVQLQNEIAARKSESGGLARLIWLPATTSPEPEQQKYIDALRSNAELQRGADLIEDNLEAFKNSVRITLKKLEEPPPKKVEPAKPGAQTVYFLCVGADRKPTVELRKFLRTQGLDVQLPVFEGDAATVRQFHEDLLNRSDSVLIFYGAGNEAWKLTTKNDLDKTRASRADNRPLPVFTYLGSPLTDHKQDYIDMGEPNLINGLEGFTEAAMQPFLVAVKGT